MFDSTEEMLDGIRALRLPSVFEEIAKGRGPPRFVLQLNAPVRFLQLRKYLRDTNPNVDMYLPLLELNREAVYAYDTASHVFVEYYYGDLEATIIGTTYQRFIAWIFVDFGYAGLESLAAEVAPDFDFVFMDQLDAFLASDSDLDSVEAKRMFLTQLNDDASQ